MAGTLPGGAGRSIGWTAGCPLRWGCPAGFPSAVFPRSRCFLFSQQVGQGYFLALRAGHPGLQGQSVDVVLRGRQPPEIFQDVLLGDEPDRHLDDPVSLGDAQGLPEDFLHQPHAFRVVVQAAVACVSDDALRAVDLLMNGEIVLRTSSPFPGAGLTVIPAVHVPPM